MKIQIKDNDWAEWIGGLKPMGEDVEVVEMTQEELSQWKLEHPKSKTYTQLRKAEYPSKGDQLDAIIKQMNYWRLNGNPLIQEMDDRVNECLAVKAKYPKE